MKKTAVHRKDPENDSFFSSNLIKLLAFFSKAELNDLGKFVHSPLNPRQETARFFDCLKKYHPSFKGGEFSKSKLYSELYPGKRFSDGVIRRNASNLLKLAEDYLAFNELKKDKFGYNKYLIEFYSAKDPGNLLIRKIQKTESLLNENPLRNHTYYHRLKQLNTLKAFYYSKEDATRRKFDNTAERIEQTWQHTVLELFSVYGAAVNDMLYFNKKYDVELLKILLKIYRAPAFKKTSATEILYYCITLSTEKRNDDTYYKLKELLEKNHKIFEKAELFGFYISLHNYVYERSLDPKNEISEEEFEIAEKMLELGLITENGKMTSEWFVNTFVKAIRASKLKFAEKFVQEYSKMLPDSERENVVNTSYAELEFAMKNYRKSLGYLAKVKFNNTWEKLRVNHMYVKIHYEMNNPELFYYITDSFKHFLKNEPSLNEYIKKTFGSFVNHTIKVFKIRSGEDKTPKLLLKKEILNSQISGNKWLLEKLNELP